MTALAEATAYVFTPEELQRIDQHSRIVEQEIEDLCIEQRAVAGHALARIVRAAHPTATRATIQGLDNAGTFEQILCDVDDQPTLLPKDVLRPEFVAVLVAALRHLRHGPAGAWEREGTIAYLDVAAAIADGDREPFRPLSERLLAAIEKQFGDRRTIRRAEISTERYDNGYFPSEIVDIDYSDGDSDIVLFDRMGDFHDDLHAWTGGFGAHTTVTIERTRSGITID